MGKTLILTEKESVALDYAKILNVGAKENGKIENDQYVITWCRGHLIAMSYPEDYDEKYKKWNIEDLPFLPDEYKYHVILPDRYKVVKEQLHRKDIDTILFAGDSGREGEYIYRLVLMMGGMKSGIKALRVWIDSFTDEEIKRGIREAKPIAEYDTLSDAGFQRSIEDYLVGMNFSRVLTCKYGRLFNSKIKSEKWKSIDVGRVMSCVLGMVVEREREIRNFKEEIYYKIYLENKEISAEWKAVEGSNYLNSPKLYKENGFKEKVHAHDLCSQMEGKKAIIEEIETFMSNKKAPLLFNLAELQNECTKKLKISPSETLEIAQALYESKLTTYPRTDARVLSTAIAKEIDINLKGLRAYPVATTAIQEILDNEVYKNIKNTSYTDDSKITDHYAIIPTGEMAEYKKLSDIQKKVFDIIVRRFLSIFYPPASYKNVKLTIKVGAERFFCSGKVLLNPGYMKVLMDTEENEEEKKGLLKYIQNKNKGDEIEVDSYNIKEGKTSAPKRYTSGSMILAMESAGNLIEDEELRAQIKGSGIGTSATRAEILKKLEKKVYIQINKKTQVIMPHEDGEAIYDILHEVLPDFLSPVITAEWEQKLEEIHKGTLSVEEHERELKEYIADKIQYIKGLNQGNNFSAEVKETEPICTCPVCKTGNILSRKTGYVCSGYKKDDENSCKFFIGKIAGVFLTKKQVKDLCEKRKTEKMEGFLSKSEKKFSARLALDEENKIKFVLESNEPEYLEDVTCPKCGKKIRKTGFGYGCSGYSKDDDNSCDFAISGTICGKKIPEKQIVKLIKDNMTDVIEGFKSKKGNKFSAKLTFDERQKIKFLFEEKKK